MNRAVFYWIKVYADGLVTVSRLAQFQLHNLNRIVKYRNRDNYLQKYDRFAVGVWCVWCDNMMV